MQAPEIDAAHWRKSRNLAVSVLVVGLVAGLGIFWIVLPQDAGGPGDAGISVATLYAVQGALILFALLAFYLNWRQDVIDHDYGEDD